MATPNQSPEKIFHKEITFSTIDEISGKNILEGYNVSGPFNNTINSILLVGGRKSVVPLSSESGEGAPYLKFHFPNGTSSNKIYLTFAVKNMEMEDGYYDYTTGIPDDYRSKLKDFIISHLSSNEQIKANGTKSKALRFTAYGSSTNKPAEAVTLYFTFSAVFSSSVAGNNNSSATGSVNLKNDGEASIEEPPGSDIRLKQDIERIGTSPGGLPIYKFRYVDSYIIENKDIMQLTTQH